MTGRLTDPPNDEQGVDQVASNFDQEFSCTPDVDILDMERLVVWSLNFVPFCVTGKRFYGLVDHVPGVLYVVTLFYHVYWVPLIPLGSWIRVVDKHGYRSAQSTSIGLSLKSVAMAWARLALLLVGFVAGAAGVGGMLRMLFEGRRTMAPLALLGMCAMAYLLSRLGRHLELAGFHRAERLAAKAGFPEDAAKDLIAKAEDERFNPLDLDSTLAPCPNCQRLLSPTTRICPRCDWRRPETAHK
jgi:hypothetical protein